MPKNPDWTRHEIRTLIQTYEEGGTHLAQQKLPNRNIKAIKTKAVKLMLQSGIPDGYIQAKHVMHKGQTQRVAKYLLTKAKQDGVLRYNPHTWIKYTVPIEWADQFTQTFNQQWNDYQQTLNWHTSQQIADALNYNRTHITRAFKDNTRLAQEIYAQVEVKRIHYPNNTLKYHPTQATKFIERYNKLMTCPNCNNQKTRVITTRAGGTKQKPDRTELKRRRHCPQCNHRFQTTELPTKALTRQLMNLQ